MFSFCLYGTAAKYVRGMHENVQDIARLFPEWKVYIYHKDTDIEPFRAYPNVVCIDGVYSGNQLMLDRFTAIDKPNVSIMMVRDADSRINKRDEWCIREFVASSKMFHIIRDHPYHTVPILGGLWGIKKGCIPHFRFEKALAIYTTQHKNKQGFDQYFLGEVIYTKIVNNVLVHDSKSIPFKHEGVFCGQVIEYSDEGTAYINQKDCEVLQQ